MATAIEYGLIASLVAVAVITVVGTLGSSKVGSDSSEQNQMLGNQSRFHNNLNVCTGTNLLKQQDQVPMVDGHMATVTVEGFKCVPADKDYEVQLSIARPGSTDRPTVWVNAQP